LVRVDGDRSTFHENVFTTRRLNEIKFDTVAEYAGNMGRVHRKSEVHDRARRWSDRVLSCLCRASWVPYQLRKVRIAEFANDVSAVYGVKDLDTCELNLHRCEVRNMKLVHEFQGPVGSDRLWRYRNLQIDRLPLLRNPWNDRGISDARSAKRSADTPVSSARQ